VSAVVEARKPIARYPGQSGPALLHAFDLFATAPGAVVTLRSLILSLAVKGKLIQQDPNDVSASELLAQIRAEPHLQETTTGPAADVPFDIPSHWEWASLGEVVELIRGITFPASAKTREPGPNKIACLRTSNVQQSIEWHDLLFVDRSFMGREVQLIRHHDIVMSMANSRELVGKVALIQNLPFPEATFGGFLGVLRPRHIDPRYVMVVLRTDYARRSLIGSASQTTNIANISLAKLRPLPFPLPPLAEQRRIVARVDELMELCDALEQSGRLADEQHARLASTLFDALATSESEHELAENWQRIVDHFDLLLDRREAVDSLEQAILEAAVRGRLVSSDQVSGEAPPSATLEGSDPKATVQEAEREFVAPEHWKWVRFGSLWESSLYGPRFSNEDYVHEGGVPTVRTTDMSGGRIRLKQAPLVKVSSRQLETYRIKRGDLLVTRSGSIGVMALYDLEHDAIPSAYLIRLRFKPCVLPEFGLLLLTSPTGQKLMGLSTTSVGVPNVNATKMSAFPVAVPGIVEQSRIIARVAELRQLCGTLRERLSAVQATHARLADALVAEVA